MLSKCSSIRLSAIAAVAVFAAPASALNIELDYSTDLSGFFSATPAAKSALDAAALDISNAITTALGAVTTDVFTGTNGMTEATFEWDLTVTNPATGGPLPLETFVLTAGTVRIYVGMRPLSGSTLGVGGPNGAGFGLSYGGFENQFPGALDAAENSSNATMSRGDGPVIGTISDEATLGSTTSDYTVIFGSLSGSLSLDNDTNNDGFVDNASTLANFWHYNHTTSVAAGKSDMYSVALHEILHALGIGAADSWDALANGSNWTGPNVIALHGTGNGVLEPDENHIVSGLMSPRLSDGVSQEVVMDPSILTGTRKSLTQLDLAFLRDIGWDTIPEPSTAVLLFGAASTFLVRRRRKELR
jgi:hypothetical protein